MKKICVFVLLAAVAAGCVQIPGDYMQVQNTPEMANMWKTYQASLKDGHAVGMFIPAWCDLADWNKADRQYCFPVYYLRHNSEAEDSFFQNTLAGMKREIDCREWAEKSMQNNGYKVLVAEKIPPTEIKLSETAWIFRNGALLSLEDPAGNRKEVKCFRLTIFIFANGRISYCEGAVTTKNASEELAAQTDAVGFAGFLQKYNAHLPMCTHTQNR